MSIVLLFLYASACGLLVAGCHQHVGPPSDARDTMIDSLVPLVSHSFKVEYYPNYKLIKVFAPDGKVSAQYVLCKKDVSTLGYLKDAVRIETPVSRIACLSTTHIGALQLLDARQLIAVTANAEMICDSVVNTGIADGHIRNAGHDYQPDYEMIASVHPQVLFSDGENGSSSQINSKLKALHISVASSRDYFEQDPLARAEWIKFFAAFINREKTADSIFEKVKAEYITTRNNVAEVGARPTVFCNLPYNGIWYMPCGENYVARLISDAGADFLWQKDKPINGLNLTLNFEQVYQRAAKADYWINPGVVYSLRQMSDQDTKFRLFRAYQTGNVYNCTKRLSTGGGMDMWETGTFRPDIVLNDLVYIFHQSNTEQRLYYYKQLK